jgi:hypothetical protein
LHDPRTSGPVASAGFVERETEVPGFGISTTLFFGPVSVVVHGLPSTLAMNIDGKVFKKSSELAPPVTSRGAQFMYISRFPTLLNQDQAKKYWPDGTSLGT